ncbi:hypothetical protein ACFQMM_13675 [Saliphagus sp. GCM10025308]
MKSETPVLFDLMVSKREILKEESNELLGELINRRNELQEKYGISVSEFDKLERE